MRLQPRHLFWIKVLIHLAGILPLLWLFLTVNQGWLSADPAKDIQHFTGRIALKWLLATLAIAPLARSLLVSELFSRPYLTLGIVSWIILLALALTSTQAMMRKLGSRWQKLHNTLYLVAILAPIHYIWSVKTLSPQPIFYTLLALILLLMRYKKFRQWWR